MKHRIGFIGFGGMGGGYHFEVARDRKDACDDLAPVAVYDVRQCQRDLAVERGLKAYDNLDEFLASDEFDIVVVATPNQFHCELTCKALEAGKHVICEKPVAMSLEEFDKMVETSHRVGKYFFVHQNRRFDTDMLIVKHAVETGRLGKLSSVESAFTGGYMEGWRTQFNHGGGILYDWGVHLIDQIVYLFSLVNDKPVSVYAKLRNENLKEVDDNTTVNITFESGATARVWVSGSSSLAPINRWLVCGEMGQLWIPEHYAKNGKLKYWTETSWSADDIDVYDENGAFKKEREARNRHNVQTVDYPDDGYELKQDWVGLYISMFDTIDNGAPMLVTHEQARQVLSIIKAAHESSKTNTVVKI